MSTTERVAALDSRSPISGWAATSPPLKTAHYRVRRRLDYPASLGLDHQRCQRQDRRVEYPLEVDLFLLTWRRAVKQGRLMIRLSDVKVRLQYRWRVRQPRLKLEDGNLREKLEKVEAQILRETLQRSAPSPRPPLRSHIHF